jgi:putative sigma-54 modulation protein
MQIEVRGQSLAVSPALSSYAERRFTTALGRFGRRIAAVAVRLSDDNGHRGGVDKRCQVEVTIPRRPALLVEERHSDAYTAVDFAADRVATAVTRELERRFVRRQRAAEWRERERTGRPVRRPDAAAS